MRIVIAGSGFIGSHLISFFEKQGHELILLSRTPTSARHHFWNPETRELDLLPLEGADVVINLAGENIFGRWNQKKMDQMRNSRLEAAQLLCSSLLSLKTLPRLFIGASAIGYYGNRGEEILDESSGPGQNFFLADLCQSWERVADSLKSKDIRVIAARFGIVLGSDGGALQHIKKAFLTGMGGTLGSGKQIMSWIAIDDVCSAMQHVIEHGELAGPINFVSPQAISNEEFTKVIGEVLNRPTLLSVPKIALNLMFGQGAEMFLASTNVIPKRLLESGYQFHYPDLEAALKHYLFAKV